MASLSEQCVNQCINRSLLLKIMHVEHVFMFMYKTVGSSYSQVILYTLCLGFCTLDFILCSGLLFCTSIVCSQFVVVLVSAVSPHVSHLCLISLISYPMCLFTGICLVWCLVFFFVDVSHVLSPSASRCLGFLLLFLFIKICCCNWIQLSG